MSGTTTGKSVTRTIHTSKVDTSSAEWITEAPATEGDGGDVVLPLADFGTATFSRATATAAGHTGTISDSHWST